MLAEKELLLAQREKELQELKHAFSLTKSNKNTHSRTSITKEHEDIDLSILTPSVRKLTTEELQAIHQV
eukprot:15329480-Ditylum_brightwellii.AAC.1